MTRIIPVLLFFLLLTFSSCVTSDYMKTSDSPGLKLAPTEASKIEVFSLRDIDRKYIVLGQAIATSDAGENSGRAVKHLKEAAARLGADAIVDLRLEFVQGGWTMGVRATGTAVKYVIE